MNKLSRNDVFVLSALEALGVRHRNPCSTMKLLDDLRTKYNMTQEESIKSMKYLGELDYLDGNGRFISFSKKFDDKLFQERSIPMTANYTLPERKAARFKMLEKIYSEAGGSENPLFDIHEIGKVLGFPEDLNRITYEYLVGENLIEFRALGGFASITHFGVTEYENAINRPDTETQYFPAANIVNNILNIHSITNSQVQVGSSGSTQIYNKKAEFAELTKWLELVIDAINTEKIDPEIKENICSEVDSIKALVQTEKPNKKYIKMALNTVRDLMIGIASNAAFQGLLAIIPTII
jgi:hypothetical protein